MGLDNSIVVKRNEYTNNIPELQRFRQNWDDKNEYDFSIVYYRKCWNIRNDILQLLGKPYPEEWKLNLTKDNVDQIIKLLQSYNSKNFTDGGSCIWDWDDEEYPYSEQIQEDIEELKTLRELMDKYNLEVYFYDSY